MKPRQTIRGSQKTKKERVLNQSTRRINPVIIAITIAAVVAAAGTAYLFLAAQARPTYSQAPAPAETPKDGPGQVAYPLSLFGDGQARHFEYRFNGTTIRYFILKSSDGIVRAAFDACDVCWPAGKGYAQTGDDMVCNNCGRHFASIRINEVKGGCNPAPLKRTIDGDHLVIRIGDIEQGQTYFNFKGKA